MITHYQRSRYIYIHLYVNHVVKHKVLCGCVCVDIYVCMNCHNCYIHHTPCVCANNYKCN